eukprot:NODE_427_length_8836_cov_0.452215.p4 type:complete len:202 gc:universal NODE_427_length_8836_cov_0.452215:7016-7621(+)
MLFNRQKTLEQKLKLNPYHPFTLSVQNSQVNVESIFTYTQRPKRFYYFGLCGIATAIILVFIMCTSSLENPYLLILIFSLLVNVLGAFHSRNKITYTINHKSKNYQVRSGDSIFNGSLYNVYIRLVKVSFPALQKNSRIHYQLYLKGFSIKSVFIGEMKGKQQLRLLGQYLAQNLNINYFDDNNTSEHHVVRYTKSGLDNK